MAKFLILSFLCISLAKNVASLGCYVTDAIALKNKGIGAEPALKDCKTYFHDLGLETAVGDDFRCATVTADTDEARIFVQSCLTPADSCDTLKNLLRIYFGQLTPLTLSNEVTCNMCDTDYCNAGVARTIEMKIRTDSGATPGYIVVICLIGALGTIVSILAVVFCCGKKKTGVVYKA